VAERRREKRIERGRKKKARERRIPLSTVRPGAMGAAAVAAAVRLKAQGRR
jgi:hypothetical protein